MALFQTTVLWKAFSSDFASTVDYYDIPKPIVCTVAGTGGTKVVGRLKTLLLRDRAYHFTLQGPPFEAAQGQHASGTEPII